MKFCLSSLSVLYSKHKTHKNLIGAGIAERKASAGETKQVAKWIAIAQKLQYSKHLMKQHDARLQRCAINRT